jgi:tyrosinase
VLNGTYYQDLGTSGCRGTNGQPLDVYSFTLPTDGVIASVVASSDIDGYLTLNDASSNVLRSDDNSYGNNDPLIVQYLPAGAYQLAVRDAAASSGGPYALALYVALGPRPPFCAPRGSLPAGGSVTGNINSAGCQYIDSTLADIYRIDLQNAGIIDLRLNSSDFDAYLVLVDPKGDLVAQDDDSGGGTNSRINMPLSAGTYYVVAKPFSDYFSQGNYTLTLAGQ